LSVFDLIYAVAIVILSPFLLLKLLFDREFRHNFSARLSPSVSECQKVTVTQANAIWVHAASIGEIRLAIKLIHAWLKTDSQKKFFITTNTIQSKTLGEKETRIPVLIAPLDFSHLVRKFKKLIKPRHLILIETEIWPNLIRLMSETGRIVVVNGRLSDRHFNGYLKRKFLLSKTFARLDWILARDPVSANRFHLLGASQKRILNTGSLKYEVPEPPEIHALESINSNFRPSQTPFLFVAGSLQPEELEHILPAWTVLQAEIPGFQMVLIPRHPNKRDEFAKILAHHKISYSFTSDASTSLRKEENRHIYIVDQMGILKSWYFLADAIFVGGSLCNKGGQNMVEAVGYKKPVCIGPYAVNFKDEVDLLLSVAGLGIVHNPDELCAFLRMCHASPEEAVKMGECGFTAIAKQAHSLDESIKKLTEIYS
jgi:3-deoxy-D-manno-octulosonic-acid transferase